MERVKSTGPATDEHRNAAAEKIDETRRAL
jgi:hypothetical protein